MGARPRVLIADDDAPFREALQEALEDEGWEVEAVASTEQACRTAAERAFDAVISDVRMPGDGARVPRLLRAIQPRVPVIVITAFDEPGVRDRILADGALDYLLKPLTLETIRGALARAFALRGKTTPG